MSRQKVHLKYIGSRTKTVEKRILSLLRRRKGFLLTTLSVKDNKTIEEWHVDSWGWVSVMTQWYFRYSNPLLSPYHVSSTYLNIFYLLLIKIIIASRLMKKEKYAN